MAARFVNVDRPTPMFLPCDLREWLPDDHLVHLILDAVEQIPTGHFRVNHRGTGSEQYPPTMMLALLIYCYATGRFGSRTLEAATYSDVAVRFICANRHPDHDSICTFRRENKAAFEAAFVTVLQLAHQLRLTRVGTVSVDGTKIAANASKHAAVSYQRAGELITRFQLEVAELTTRAEQADVQQSKETLDIPAELARREKRIESLKHARQIIEAQAKERAAAQQAEHQAKVAERQAQRDAGKKPRGPEPKAPDDKPGDKGQYNFTDPESRIMKAGNGKHFEQAYNAQAAVDEAMLIVGQRVSVAANDKQELAADVAAISPVVKAEVKAVLVDSGFYSEAMVRAVEQPSDGTASGLTVYAAVDKQSHHKSVADLLPQPEPEPLGENAGAQEKMAHRMRTQAGKTLYKLRKQTVEPVFGIIKEVLGFRRFLLRGREKVSLEWLLVCVSYNLKRLFTLITLAVTG
jgi:transposase